MGRQPTCLTQRAAPASASSWLTLDRQFTADLGRCRVLQGGHALLQQADVGTKLKVQRPRCLVGHMIIRFIGSIASEADEQDIERARDLVVLFGEGHDGALQLASRDAGDRLGDLCATTCTPG